MSNKLCLYERGQFTEPEMCNLWQKNSISYNSCRFSVVIASVGLNIYRVTTQHTPKCAGNCFDNKIPYNCPSNSYQIFCKLNKGDNQTRRIHESHLITLKTAFFSQS